MYMEKYIPLIKKKATLSPSVCMSISCLCNGFNFANTMTHHCTLSLYHLKPLHILKINLATSISTPLMPRHYLTDVLEMSLDIF